MQEAVEELHDLMATVDMLNDLAGWLASSMLLPPGAKEVEVMCAEQQTAAVAESEKAVNAERDCADPKSWSRRLD